MFPSFTKEKEAVGLMFIGVRPTHSRTKERSYNGPKCNSRAMLLARHVSIWADRVVDSHAVPGAPAPHGKGLPSGLSASGCGH